MSKVNAYQCDFCGVVKTEEHCNGISSVQNAFDPLESNKVCECEKSEVHFCLECYREQVLVATENMCFRKRFDEDNRQKVLKEMTYAFKQAIFYKLKEKSLKKKGKKFVS